MTTRYAGLAEAWATDAALVYGPLAEHLVRLSPVPLTGLLALDAGAGSGVAGDVLRARGARVVAADLEPDMVTASRGPAVVGDVTALPFADDAFDLAVAAFVVNHLADPAAGLAELRRVVRPGGTVLASSFSLDRAPAKTAVDEVAAAYGFTTPDWYAALQEHAAAVGTPEALAGRLRAAGFTRFDVTASAVDLGLSGAADVVRYRLALPHLRAFAASLDPEVRSAFVEDTVRAVAASDGPFAPVVIEAVALS